MSATDPDAVQAAIEMLADKKPAVLVDWVDAHREPKCRPNPEYPAGIDLDLAAGRERACKVEVPYPSRRCGFLVLTCLRCGYSATVTTAGRPDDPRSVRLPCAVH